MKTKENIIIDDDSFLSFVFAQMELLDSNSIDVEQAKIQAALARQANIITNRINTRPQRKIILAEYEKEIRIMLNAGIKRATIAKMCNCNKSNITRILNK
jgi:DNA invertase Pin-like site-specific DNA recombinase